MAVTTGPSLLDDFAEHARAHPTRVAVSGVTDLTYGELLDRVRRNAGALRAAGARPWDVVAVACASDVATVEWLLSVAWAGCTQVTVDPAMASERSHTILIRARPALVVSDRPAPSDVAGPPWRTATELAAGAASPQDDPFPVHPGTAAYLCFTSGSTGTPKGVAVPYRAIRNTVVAKAAVVSRPEPARILVVSPWFFDVAMGDLWTCFGLGGTLLVDRRERALGGGLARMLAEDRVTLLECVTTFIESIPPADLRHHPADLTVILGGQRLPPAVLRSLPERWNVALTYGPTETAVNATLAPLGSAREAVDALIGVPFAGVTCHVVDEDLRLVDPGVEGELLVGGAGLASGYVGDPRATADRFVPDSFSGVPGARLYRTGDVVRRLPDGGLIFVGRLDDQVKVRGFRVEPGEVEVALLRHPAVSAAAVRGWPDPAGDLQLVGYVLHDAPPVNELRAHLGRLVPEYMVPTAWVRLAEFPLTATAKVARRLLPPPQWTVEPCAVPGRSDLAETERLVAQVWSSVLGVAHVDRDDNFLDLGGHSLKALQVTRQLSDATGRDVPVSTVLRSGSLRELSDALAQAPSATGPADDATVRVNRTQQGIWLSQQLAGDIGLYHLVAAVHLTGALRAAALRDALDAVQYRHPALHSRLVLTDQGLDRVDVPPEPVALPVEDLPDGATLDTHLARLALIESRVAIDTAAEPPWRARLLRAGTDRHVLLLTVHHAMVDGIALGRLIDDVAAAYSTLETGAPVDPTPVLVAERAAGAERLDRDLAFWTRALADAPFTATLPGGRARPRRRDHAGQAHTFTVDPDQVRWLAQAAHRGGVSPHTLLLTVFARAVLELAALDEMVIGTTISLRDVYDVPAGCVGQFTTILPVRLALTPEQTLPEALVRVQAALLSGMDHRSADGNTLARRMKVPRRPGYSSLFQVGFAYEERPPMAPFAGLCADWELLFNGWSEHDLTLELTRFPHGGIGGQVVSARSLYPQTRVQELIERFCAGTRAAASDAAGPVRA